MISQGNKITPTDMKVYYQFLNGDRAQVMTLPTGLKMIAGNHMATRENPGRQVVSWRCAGGGEQPAEPGGNQHDMQVCPEGP